MEKLQNVKELLKNFSLEVHAINNRLEKCSCLGKQLFCLLSVIALECGIFLDALSSNNDNTLDAVLSLKQKQSLLQILEFTIHNGVVSNLDFQISMLIPKSQNSCQMSMLDLFVCCRLVNYFKVSDFSNPFSEENFLWNLFCGLCHKQKSLTTFKLIFEDLHSRQWRTHGGGGGGQPPPLTIGKN